MGGGQLGRQGMMVGTNGGTHRGTAGGTGRTWGDRKDRWMDGWDE